MQAQPHILIADDSASLRRTLEHMITDAGYQTTTVDDGAKALQACETTRFDVIVLDVLMPEIDGLTACQKLKVNPSTQHIPVMLITASDAPKHVDEAFDAGADDFLPKPLSAKLVALRLRALCRMKRLYDEQQRLLKLREDLANMLVHDMRNPLTSIVASGQFLRMAGSYDPETVDHLLLQAQRLTQYTNDLLLQAKMEEGAIALSRQVLSVQALLRETAHRHHMLAKTRKIRLVVDEASLGSQSIYVDPNLFERVLDNLVWNAIKYSPTGESVTLGVEPQLPAEKNVNITIRDRGPGIPEDSRARLFDKYEILQQRGANDDARIGLGLAFCKLVMDAHHGTIQIRNQPDGGSVFVLGIPAPAASVNPLAVAAYSDTPSVRDS